MRATIHGTQAVFPGAVAKFYILQQPPPAAKPWTPKACSACTAARDRTDNPRIKPAPAENSRGRLSVFVSPPIRTEAVGASSARPRNSPAVQGNGRAMPAPTGPLRAGIYQRGDGE